jgi:serine phosphatase RsbU (regulator of sigma subunit)/tetratricopeptide (TPR) repeat protein
MMKQKCTYRFWLTASLLVMTTLLCAQKKTADSLYQSYFKSAKAADKIDKAAALVLFLGNHHEAQKAHAVINDLASLKVEVKNEAFKKGMVLFCKALLYRTGDSISESMLYANQSIPYFKSNPYYLAEVHGLMAMNYYLLNEFDSCIAMGNRVLASVEKSRNANAELEILMTMGRSYDFMGNRQKGIEISLKGIEVAKREHKTIKLSELYISMSIIYKGEDLKTAKKYALMALDVLRDKPDREEDIVLNAAYLMLGNVYLDYKDLDSAMYYYELSKNSSLKNNDERTYMSAIGNIGNVAYNLKEYDKAIEYNLLTLQGYRKNHVKSEIAVAYGSLADIYKDMKNYPKAILYYDSALTVTKEIQSADDFIYNYKGLSETYERMGNDKEAFKYFKLYRQWNDSVNNNQNSKKIAQLELDYKYKSEQKEKDLIQENKDLITQEKLSRQKYIIWMGILGTVLLLGFLGFTIKSNINRKKINAQLQAFNEEVTRQKDIIEEKNNEITDSITYASRIQQGVIPDDQEMNKLFPKHFVFFKPRDIVSGDFYWANRVGNTSKAIIAVADCTGHGVPGAFMSLVGNTLLNQTLNQPSIDTPAQALDYINQQLPKTIKSKSTTGAIKDGMEITMCEFDPETMTMNFAGANSNIYLVRNGAIRIYKGDKQPIGESLSGNEQNYTNHIIPLQKDDCIYMITDGFADQFGGEKGKKFKYKPLEDLFCAVSGKNPQEQKDLISSAFNNWRLNHEQVDDVLVIGIKL